MKKASQVTPHLVHPPRREAIGSARLKNDKARRRDLDEAAARGPAAGGAGSPRRPVRQPLVWRLRQAM